MFIHALGTIPTTWFLDAYIHQHTRHWGIMTEDFMMTFGLVGGMEKLDEALQDIDALIFDEFFPRKEFVVPALDV